MRALQVLTRTLWYLELIQQTLSLEVAPVQASGGGVGCLAGTSNDGVEIGTHTNIVVGGGVGASLGEGGVGAGLAGTNHDVVGVGTHNDVV